MLSMAHIARTRLHGALIKVEGPRFNLLFLLLLLFLLVLFAFFLGRRRLNGLLLFFVHGEQVVEIFQSVSVRLLSNLLQIQIH